MAEKITQKETTLLEKLFIYPLSLLGALGTALQNYIAVAELTKSLMSISLATSKAGISITHSMAISLGGICSGLVNFCINIGLLKDFLKRLINNPIPKDFNKWSLWTQLKYCGGIIVFVGTGILFGLTAFTFGSIGVLSAISIAAGIFVAAIMIIQELETWFKSFDPPKSKKDKTKKTKTTLEKVLQKLGKLSGNLIAIGNVVALSLLFTLGLATFLMSAGMAAFPAVMIGFGIAFTGGAFTEFFFYNWFLSKFCKKFVEMWEAFWASTFSPLGLLTASLNGIVNGVLAYVGIMMLPPLLMPVLTSLFIAIGFAAPPIAIVITVVTAIAIPAAIFAGLASFILGLDFWESNSQHLPSLFGMSTNAYVSTELGINPAAPQTAHTAINQGGLGAPESAFFEGQAVAENPNTSKGIEVGATAPVLG